MSLQRIMSAIKRNSLWVVGLGVMAASSGIDGAYMSTWMPAGAGWLGYVLNSTSDLGSEVLMYWFGRLRQERKGSKKWRLAALLLPAEVVIVGFSWFFSWRQLLRVLGPIEGAQARWVAPVSAAFAPVLLASIGYAQALLAGKFAEATQEHIEEAQSDAEEKRSDASATHKRAKQTYSCPRCGATHNASGEPFRSKNAISAHLRFCTGRESEESEPVAIVSGNGRG